MDRGQGRRLENLNVKENCIICIVHLIYSKTKAISSLFLVCIFMFNYVLSGANYQCDSSRLDYLPDFRESCSIDKNLWYTVCITQCCSMLDFELKGP